jgi:cysteine desulfurase/selenocysteine lyase
MQQAWTVACACRTIGDPGTGHDTTDDPGLQALYDRLVGGLVRLSIRRGQLRFSLHLYNDGSDVNRVLDMVDTWRGRRGSVGRG